MGGKGRRKPNLIECPWLSEYDHIIIELVKEMGGFVDAHTHLDRANTLNTEYFSHIGIDPIEAGATLSLRAKQNLTGHLHLGLGYQEEDLYRRMESHLLRLITMNSREVTSFIDATPDIGLKAIGVALNLKSKLIKDIDFKIAVSPIFGFKNPAENPDRWEVYKEAAQMADILGGLPEKDDATDRIGFDGHIKRILLLAHKLGKPAHFHVDQANDPSESGMETLIEAVRWLGSPKVEGKNTEPTVWAVHVISPSCYSEERFNQLVANLIKYNIGVICCPAAAISMRQNRNVLAPLHNSIARILEMAQAGVRIKLGSDNVCDVFVPSGRGSILDEIYVLSNAVRFYIPLIFAKIAAGQVLNEIDKEMIKGATDGMKDK